MLSSIHNGEMRLTLVIVLLMALGIAGTMAGHLRYRGVVAVKTGFTVVAALAVGSLWLTGDGAGAWLTGGFFVGLVLCAIADYLLAPLDNSATFAYGLGAFLAGYATYALVLLAAAVREQQAGFWVWLAWVLGMALLVAAVSLLQYRSFRAIPDRLYPAVRVYMVVVSTLFVAAFAYLFAAVTAAAGGSAAAPGGLVGLFAAVTPARVLIMVGVIFIYVSDSLIAHNIFSRPLVNNQLWIMPTYYIGQTLIVAALHARYH